MNGNNQPATPTRSFSKLGFLNLAALIGILYFAQDFLVPVVLAALVSFLLDPLNRWMERRGIKHLVAVLTTTVITFIALGAIVFLVTTQIIELASQLPHYKNNLVEKAKTLKSAGQGPIGRAVETLREVAATLEQKETPPSTGKPQTGNQQVPLAVEVVPTTSEAVATATSVVGPILAPLGTVAVVLLLAIFMMIGRDDLRDRVIHLMGRSRLRLTTHALDEAGRRVSRYLFAQLLVNVSYGIPIGIGLYFIGIPNAMLWGVMATVLRFLPYIGPWIAAAFPVALSVAVSNSWQPFLLTIGLFIVVELISNNVVEPWLYGAKTGLSPLAVVVSAIFWTWLWGIPGLLLATPVTVCLVVMGRYVPRLRMLDLMLGDRPPITLSDRLYHRLLMRDSDEALELLQSKSEEENASLVTAIDEVALPAVRQIEADFNDGLLLETKRNEALLHLREVVAELSDARETPHGTRAAVLCMPAGNLADELGADMLMAALRLEGVAADCLSSGLTSGEAVAKAAELEPSVICISVVSPQSLIAATFMCRHLRARLPEAKLMVGLWQVEDDEYRRRATRLEGCGGNRVLPTIARVISAIAELMPPDWDHAGPEAPMAPATPPATPAPAEV